MSTPSSARHLLGASSHIEGVTVRACHSTMAGVDEAGRELDCGRMIPVQQQAAIVVLGRLVSTQPW